MSIPNWPQSAVDAATSTLDYWASVYALPRDIVYGQVALESGFNPNALGAVGEIGLFQLRPTTAAMLGYTGDSSGLYDVDTNVQYGLLYLRNQLDRYNGDIDKALSAYNAGSAITGNAAYVQGVHDRADYFSGLWGTPPGQVATSGSADAALLAGAAIVGAVLFYMAKAFGFLK